MEKGSLVYVFSVDELKSKYGDEFIYDPEGYQMGTYKKSPFFMTLDMIAYRNNSEMGPGIGSIVDYVELDDPEHPGNFYHLITFNNDGEYEQRFYADWMFTEIKDGKKCPFCGEDHDENLIEIDGYYVCNACFAKYAKRCSKCNCNHLPFSMKNIEDRFFCKECVKNLVICDKCKKICSYTVKVITKTGVKHYCKSCSENNSYKCSDCGERYNYDSVTKIDGKQICPNCYKEKRYKNCNNCGRAFIPTGSETLCEECQMSGSVRPYHSRPEISYFKADTEKPKTQYYLGFELEVGGCSTNSKVMKCCYNLLKEYDWEKYFHFEHDGSIPNYGMELISQPMTMEYHRHFAWDKILQTVAENDIYASDGCGLHIHVSRNAFSIGKGLSATYNATQWAKLDLFLNTHKKFFEKLARRSSCRFAQYKGGTSPVTARNYKENYGKSYDRYSAINFGNKGTVEFRIFKTTLDYNVLMASLELVDSLIKWIPTITVVKLVNPSTKEPFESYLKYVMMCRKNYKFLHNYLISKGYIEDVNKK